MKGIFFAITFSLTSFIQGEVTTLEKGKIDVTLIPVQQSGRVEELDPQKFQDFINKATQPVVVEFFSPDCPYCQKMEPIFAQVAKERTDITCAKINIDNSKADPLSSSYGIEVIPTFVVFKGGKSYGNITGSRKKEDLKTKIDEILKK